MILTQNFQQRIIHISSPIICVHPCLSVVKASIYLGAIQNQFEKAAATRRPPASVIEHEKHS